MKTVNVAFQTKETVMIDATYPKLQANFTQAELEYIRRVQVEYNAMQLLIRDRVDFNRG